ncbi:hypothetical protein H2200_007971 [Cladophialophora chaetospira]|uniref:Methyltransferase domain-containing protein n=1 Tax=Cladophialophora chaetospira TaxID=386627 RepID=A0AA38X6S5_9EURO|nr:hypothetical protein H2200_007971 [Cladophialophora chaetospira]
MSFSHRYFKQAPSFDSETYWDERFAASQPPFEWLVSLDDTASILEREIGRLTNNLEFRSDERDSSILHIGCGTSDLSLILRDFVRWPSQVHNVDFSQRALEHGRQREKQCFGPGASGFNDDRDELQHEHFGSSLRWMRWSKVDLLSRPSVLSLIHEDDPLYGFIVDKGTSDAIACGELVNLDSRWGNFEQGSTSRTFHPVQILALHLAAVTSSAGRWIVISYSAERFWFLEEEAKRDSDFLAQDIAAVVPEERLEPARFWRLERKERMSAFEAESPIGRTVHRPQICNWLYVLVRTNLSFSCHEPLYKVDRRIVTNDKSPV